MISRRPITTAAGGASSGTRPASRGGLAIDADNVYWGINGGAAFWCPRSGCGENWRVLAKGVSVEGLVLHDGQVYFGDRVSERVYWCPLTGCSDPLDTTRSIALEAAPGHVAVGGGALYWTSFYGGFVGACRIDDCAATKATLVAGVQHPGWIVADDAAAYWIERGAVAGETDEGRIVRRGTDGTMSVLASGRQLQGLAMDDAFLYWSEAGWVVKCATSGCVGAPTRIAHSFVDYPSDLAVDGTSVYWTEPSSGAIVKARK